MKKRVLIVFLATISACIFSWLMTYAAANFMPTYHEPLDSPERIAIQNKLNLQGYLTDHDFEVLEKLDNEHIEELKEKNYSHIRKTDYLFITWFPWFLLVSLIIKSKEDLVVGLVSLVGLWILHFVSFGEILIFLLVVTLYIRRFIDFRGQSWKQ